MARTTSNLLPKPQTGHLAWFDERGARASGYHSGHKGLSAA
jgi:hypothetical protein